MEYFPKESENVLKKKEPHGILGLNNSINEMKNKLENLVIEQTRWR